MDIGGTFTDVCVFDRALGEIRVTKVPSRPDEPIEALLEGVRDLGLEWADVALFVHGTTVATNALIARSFPRAAMVTTKGFRDVIEIRRGTKEDLWDTYKDVAPPYIRRRDRLVVSERVDHQGNVVEPLDEQEALGLAAVLRKRGVETVAICFINAYANPAHELRMRQILEEQLPGVAISTSSELVPEIFEHERFSTTVANAVLAPMIDRYAGELQGAAAGGGYSREVLLLHSGGGVMTAQAARKYPVRLAGSGLAAGAVAARHIASQCGFDKAIALDMGGTSTDVSLVYGGQSRMTDQWYVEYGYPILFPSTEVISIGAGGGTIAWIDDGGALRNGPQSAGAVPGPACYGLGNAEPTNTDANLVLGRLGDSLLGGNLVLDRERAVKAIRNLAERLDLGTSETASAIIDVTNAHMADALRLISVRRGYDPREFALVAFGGAGPLHGAALAAELSIPTVIIPQNPGLTSALGCLLVDVRHDFSKLCFGEVADLDESEVESDFRDLEMQARSHLATEGIAPADMVLMRTIDMRYAGQWRSLSIPVTAPLESLATALADFHDRHEREHAYRRDDSPVEAYRLNLAAFGVTPKASFKPQQLSRPGRAPAASGRRQVVFPGASAPIESAIHQRAALAPGVRLVGPAVIEQLDSTIVVPPRVEACVDEWNNIQLDLSAVM